MRVAFIGPLQSGKTTASKFMVDQYGYTRMSFAQGVKDVTLAMLETFQNEMETDAQVDSLASLELVKSHPSIRGLLQLVGTELGREFYGPENIWVDRLTESLGTKDNITVDDCRFENEYNALAERGFVFVRLIRDYKLWQDDLRKTYTHAQIEAIMSHPSETTSRSFDAHVTIHANTVKELYEKLTEVVESYSLSKLSL